MKYLLFVAVFLFSPLAAVCSAAEKAPVFLYREQLKGMIGRRAVFWVCSGKARLQKLGCDDLGVHETEGRKADLDFSFIELGQKHSFGLRHAIQKDACLALVAEIKKRLAARSGFCVRGQLAADEPTEIGWVFQEFKSGHLSVCENEDCSP